VLAIDALRGFDMFWIIGGEGLVFALRAAFPGKLTTLLATQMEHVAWEGLRFYDLIFPLFVFIVGVALVFSLGRILESHGRAAAFKRVLVRSLVLYILGVAYYGGLAKTVGDIRLLGVLQRIALCYLFAGLLFLLLRREKWTRTALALGIALAVLLVAYWALMTFVRVPVWGAGDYAEGHNLANYLDSRYLPLFKWDGDHDPEGLLSTLPAIGTCLLGVLTGLLLRSQDMAAQRKVLWLAGAGLVSLALGYLWGLQFPVIKKIWTSSYVLAAGGWSALLLALFYQVIEIWHWRGWAMPFVWIGANAIMLYLLFSIVDFSDLARRFLGGPVSLLFGRYADLLVAAGVVALVLLLAGFLYRRRVFIRI